MIGTERGHHPSALEQHHADERRDLPRLQCRAVGVAQPRLCPHVVDDDGLAALERLAQFIAYGDPRPLSGERWDAVRVLAKNGVLAALEFRIADAGRAEVLSQEPCGGLLDVAGIAQRPERIVEPKEKLESFFVCAQL